MFNVLLLLYLYYTHTLYVLNGFKNTRYAYRYTNVFTYWKCRSPTKFHIPTIAFNIQYGIEISFKQVHFIVQEQCIIYLILSVYITFQMFSPPSRSPSSLYSILIYSLVLSFYQNLILQHSSIFS